jgi:hypothetical protein
MRKIGHRGFREEEDFDDEDYFDGAMNLYGRYSGDWNKDRENVLEYPGLTHDLIRKEAGQRVSI